MLPPQESSLASSSEATEAFQEVATLVATKRKEAQTARRIKWIRANFPQLEALDDATADQVVSQAQASKAKPKSIPPPQGTPANSNNNKRKAHVVRTPSAPTPPAKHSRTCDTSRQPTPSPAPPASGTTRSYAQATAQPTPKRKQPVHYPHMLHVHLGKEDRAPMDAPIFLALRKAMSKLVLENARSTNPFPLRVAFTELSQPSKSCAIACLDEASKAWWHEQVDQISLGGTTFRAWDAPEPNIHRPARITVTDLGMSPKEVLDCITGLNPDIKGEIILLKEEIIRQANGHTIVILGLNDEAAVSLSQRVPRWSVELGLCRRRVSYKGKRDLLDRLNARNDKALSAALRSALQPTEDSDDETEDIADTNM